MECDTLHAISPIDGRYWGKTQGLGTYFSEFALINYRLMVEVEYFAALCELGLPQLADFPQERMGELRALYLGFDDANARLVKAIEQQTNHDVKAVEYYLKERMDELGLGKWREFVHFGLTSQDINNTAFPSMLKAAVHALYYPHLQALLDRLLACAQDWAEIPMLGRTHGQPASPTRLGKEILVFASRIQVQLTLLQRIPISAKFGGATGNFNAHHVAYPEVDWPAFADHFVGVKLGLERSRVTTQIDNYDNLGAIFDAMRRINIILIDFCRDIWTYISLEYFRQAVIPSEVGSSAMPHKVNPIDFENAEGNLGVANALFAHLGEKLPFASILKGLGRISVNQEVIHADLERHWVVVAEGIQTILRREGVPDAYELLKDLTRRDVPPRQKEFEEFIAQLPVSAEVKRELRTITPFTYTGVKI